ncbi:MAG: glycosyltransferase [Deltaproteobacteria bacterium HGW-Deltaproteobacteria-13]|jgi:dolichol-phosphate mannosyltransferase|nr:MAG: glycosyltransferase [Deltaproteobacteria bacterium HGW-Deltaproteobacteria-13]
MFDRPDISIVVPVYGSDSTLAPLYERIAAAATRIPASFELIFVDDGGPGRPWELINELAKRDPRVTGLKMSRNFGQHRAIMAGVDIARGNWLVIMDCDLQDRPEEIPRLWGKAQEGHDVVVGRRVERQDRIFERLSSRLFHWFFGYLTDQKSDAAQATFGIYARKVVDSVKRLSEQPGIFPLLVRQTGFQVTTIAIAHDKRADGKSSYTLGRKLSLARDIIVSCSDTPRGRRLQRMSFMAVAAFCFGSAFLVRYFLFDDTPAAWTGATVSLFFLSGIILLGMGIRGIYTGRIFNHVKERPLYAVKDRTPMSVKK